MPATLLLPFSPINVLAARLVHTLYVWPIGDSPAGNRLDGDSQTGDVGEGGGPDEWGDLHDTQLSDKQLVEVLNHYGVHSMQDLPHWVLPGCS